MAALLPATVWAGHESPFYPSFYPQEIKIEALDPRAAAAGWPQARVHAYVGGPLFAAGAVPTDASAVVSLRSYVVLSFDATRGPYALGSISPKDRCAAADRVLRLLPRSGEDYVFHPYAITPYHADYLDQADLAAAALSRYSNTNVDPGAGSLRIRAIGPLPERLVGGKLTSAARDWDATLGEVDLESLGGGPALRHAPWIKQGWFLAHRLYTQGLVANTAGVWAEHAYRRLVTGDYRSDVDRINLERSFVTMLAGGCERVVVGYTLRREYFTADYSNGVEDVAFDSQAGLNSSIFPRAVKLKDFPWNGWLRVGIGTKPAAAWNPVDGFDDPFGRLLWRTLADPALLSEPYGGSWIANRGSIVAAGGSRPVKIPATAQMPEAGTGRLHPVGAGRRAQQKLRYSLVASAFHDGAAASVADLIYPYMFAYRWGEERRPGNGGHDPGVARSTSLLREWLAGFQVIGIETLTRDYGADIKFTYQVPVVDVYLNHRSSDPWTAAATVPPWSTIPWHVLVLMEEAVARGIAAFSSAEAQRRGIPWLDLVRDPALGARLAALVEEFRQQGYRPAILETMVTADEARERWTSLAAFYARYGHFLVTNGPYRLESWTPSSATLAVFRDLSYPLGVGSFDRYAVPLKGYIGKVEDRGDRLELQAEVERVVHAQRSYDIERGPLVAAAADTEEEDAPPQCRYIVVGPDGKVLRASVTAAGSDGRFVIELAHLGAPGLYTVAAALLVGGNTVDPQVRLTEHRIARADGRRPAAPRRRANSGATP